MESRNSTPKPVEPPLRGSDGWDYESIADRLVGKRCFSDHNLTRAGREMCRENTLLERCEELLAPLPMSELLAHIKQPV